MANHKDHKGIGIVAGAIAAAYTTPAEVTGMLAIAEFAGGGFGGAFGASLPDILEPATSSHHRKFFHAIVPAGVTIKLGTGAVLSVQKHLRTQAMALMGEAEIEPDPWRRLGLQLQAMTVAALAGAVVGSAAGYVSHLALDAMTPRGLPLLC